ncbi:MAG: Crp/Fnr family transcriptional regulator [Candidatus Sumerlaeia bacterium]|nr:Crp/Fnr family transcriptional regulator [Candidatus Sumerlaeia bacterium]
MRSLWYLSQMDFFEELGEESRLSLARHAEVHVWAAKTDASAVIASGRVFLITEGRLELSHLSSQGRQLCLGHLEPGSVIGAFDEVGDAMDEFTCNHVRALEESGAVSFTKKYFHGMLGRRPAVAGYVMRYLSECRRRLEKRLVGVLFRSNEAKVASILLELAEDGGVRKPGGRVVLDPAPSHIEIGAMVGLPREEVSRALGALRDQGLAEQGRRRIEIPDLGRLRETLR